MQAPRPASEFANSIPKGRPEPYSSHRPYLMNPAPPLYVRVGTETRGPYGMGQLRELAEVGVVTEATECAVALEGPWTPLGTTTDAPLVFPPRPELGFKEREITRLNRDSTPPVDLQAIIDQANRPLSPAVAASAPRARADAPPSAPNEVERMVTDVNEKLKALEPPPPPPPKWRPSSLQVLCAVLLVTGNAALASLRLFYDFADELSGLILWSWMGLFGGGVVIFYISARRHEGTSRWGG